MWFVKKFFIVIIILAILLGGYFFIVDEKYKNLDKIKFNIKPPNIANFKKDLKNQGSTLSSRLKETNQHVQNILGDNIQENENQDPIYVKSLEYGRYLYCKQVVQDYEQTFKHSSESTQSTQ